MKVGTFPADIANPPYSFHTWPDGKPVLLELFADGGTTTTLEFGTPAVL